MSRSLDERLALLNPQGGVSEIIRTAYRSIYRKEIRQILTEDERSAISTLCFLTIELSGVGIVQELFDFAASFDNGDD